MTQRRALAALVLGALFTAGGVAACFPDYAIGTQAGDGGPASRDGSTTDGTATGDGTTNDGTSPDGADDGATNDGTTGEGATGNDGGTSGDGSGQGDGATSNDAGVVGNVVLIDGGLFFFEVQPSTGPTVDASARLDYTLAIDQKEVTVGRFQKWIEASMPLPTDGQALDTNGNYPSMTWDAADWNDAARDPNYDDGGSGSTNCNGPGGKGPTYDVGDPSLPMNCVTWQQALAFCWFDNHRRLPTDTEWRVVATSEGRQLGPYPWGSAALDCSHAIYNGTAYCGWPVDAGTAVAGATLDGVLDIVGSLSEWIWDTYDAGSYAYPADAGTDYPGPSLGPTAQRLWLGGDWTMNAAVDFEVTQPGQQQSEPKNPFDSTGFRCAQSLP